MTSYSKRARRFTLGLLLAGSFVAAPMIATAQTAFTMPDRTPEAKVSFSAGERGKPIEAGSEAAVSGQGFKPGQQVTLLYGATPLPGGPLTADSAGKVTSKIAIPANATPGTYPIVVAAQNPYYATVADLKVSPTIPLSGQANYTITEAKAAPGLYQSAYSARNDALFVTSSSGRPPVQQSALLKLNADTLQVVARATPSKAPAAPGGAAGSAGVYAVYGIGLDDSKDTVWVTNTRQSTVAVYRQSDLSLVKQFPSGAVPHSRDVVIDSAVGRAYASATGTPEVRVFNTGSLDAAKTIQIRSQQRGQEFSGMSLSLDAKAHRLYVASMSTNEVAIINTQTDTVDKVLPVPGARNVIGVSHDPQTGRIFVAAQGSDNLVILDGNSGAVIADTLVGAGALNVVFDPVKRRAYVSNRAAGTIAVTDADGKIVANLGPAPLANHVSLGKGGTVFAVDKSANALGEDNDAILRIQPRG